MDQFISLRSIYSLNSFKEVLLDKSVIFWDYLYLPVHDFSINFAFLVILRLIMLSVFHFDPFCWIGSFIFPVTKCKLHCVLSLDWGGMLGWGKWNNFLIYNDTTPALLPSCLCCLICVNSSLIAIWLHTASKCN